ncbi:acyltransferase [Chryseobacterium sp. RU33C]|uniref:acyltransferase n=1 Tax=Chryseobacterium sp. RU33C TaxID=1907398 RepID=UPI0009557DFB|nr:acyltransferase [Chryseobacterium sp. RU33C]SIR12555.1 Acetyltransferase (isoleucine patch superfamily) [Chryseobacterium sp. RU33C]
MKGRDQFKKFKKIIDLFVKIFSFLGKNGNEFLLRRVRNTNGKLGLVLRYIFIKNLAKKVGDNVSVQPGVFIFNLNYIEFGNNISIHPMCYLEGAGGIKIGNDVSIAHATTLISTNHTWEDLTTPIKYNKEVLKPIVIEDDVWVGCGVRILSGVIIKRRSIVAAGAVVNKTFEENSIIGGVPAKIIKKL